MVPRGMIGYTTEFMSMTRGYGIINHTSKNLDLVLKHKLVT